MTSHDNPRLEAHQLAGDASSSGETFAGFQQAPLARRGLFFELGKTYQVLAGLAVEDRALWPFIQALTTTYSKVAKEIWRYHC